MATRAQLDLFVTVLLSRESGKKKLATVQMAMDRTFTGAVVQLVANDWDAHTKSCSFSSRWLVTELQMWFNPAVIQFQGLLHRSEDILLLK